MWNKYELTAEQVQGLANLCKQEQGTIEGARAEACLMANLLEGSDYFRQKYGTDIYSFARYSGWFSKATYWMDHGDAGEGYRAVIRSVLADGKRVLPPYINEHDCFSDITTATGVSKKNDRSQYHPGKTIIRNSYGSTYTFHCFPTWTSDPFGYTKKTDFLPSADDLINRAETYLGMAEPSGDDYFIRVYNSITGEGFPLDVAWCAIFVSVVARLIGAPESIIPTFADCDEGKAWFLSKKRYMRSRAHGGSYTPKRGDVVFYSSRKTQEDSTHVGYVVSCDGTNILAIEGNHADAVGYRHIEVTDAKIIGYGMVADYLANEQTEDWKNVDMKAFIKHLYVDELLREPSENEVAAWVKDIQTHGRNPEDLFPAFTALHGRCPCFHLFRLCGSVQNLSLIHI